MSMTRRQLLGGLLGTGAAVVLAGCQHGSGTASSTPTGVSVPSSVPGRTGSASASAGDTSTTDTGSSPDDTSTETSVERLDQMLDGLKVGQHIDVDKFQQALADANRTGWTATGTLGGANFSRQCDWSGNDQWVRTLWSSGPNAGKTFLAQVSGTTLRLFAQDGSGWSEQANPDAQLVRDNLDMLGGVLSQGPDTVVYTGGVGEEGYGFDQRKGKTLLRHVETDAEGLVTRIQMPNPHGVEVRSGWGQDYQVPHPG